jgi:hypothetical protein
MIALRRKEAARMLVREDGFLSALLVILIVTLTLMGLGAFMLLKTEAPNIVNEVSSLRAEYAMNAGVYYGLRRLNAGPLNESTPITFGGSSVWMDTSKISGSTDILLTVTGTSNNATRDVTVRLSAVDRLVDNAIWTTGTVLNVSGKDSTGVINASVVESSADSVSVISTATLNSLSTSQGHNQTAATYIPTNNYPAANFYNSGSTPNVTHVSNSMQVNSGITIWGIFVVDGNVTLASGATVNRALQPCTAESSATETSRRRAATFRSVTRRPTCARFACTKFIRVLSPGILSAGRIS